MSAIEERLHTLSDRFLRELPNRLSSISRLLLRVQGDPLEQAVAEELERQLHTLAGTAGSYSFPAVGSLAAEGEAVCHDAGGAMTADDLEYLGSLIGDLHDELNNSGAAARNEARA